MRTSTPRVGSTCLVAMIDTKTVDGSIASYNFENFANVVPGTQNTYNRFPSVDDDFRINLCGASPQFERDHMMPNSLNTFNRFWLSHVLEPNTLKDQPKLFIDLYSFDDAAALCSSSRGSLP